VNLRKKLIYPHFQLNLIIIFLSKVINIFTFDLNYKYYKLAASIIFQNDHSLCVSKLIWLYYKNGHDMILDHIHEFVLDIYKTKFFKLFFHWSWQIRNMFYYFVLFFLNHRINYMFIPKSKINRRPSKIDIAKKQNEYAENVIKNLKLYL